MKCIHRKDLRVSGGHICGIYNLIICNIIIPKFDFIPPLQFKKEYFDFLTYPYSTFQTVPQQHKLFVSDKIECNSV